MAGDPGHHGTMASMLARRGARGYGPARAGEGPTADPCAEGGSRRQQVAGVRTALPVVEPPDVAAASDAIEAP